MAAALDTLVQFSDALAERVAGASPIAASISAHGRRVAAGALWRSDVVVASEQVFPDLEACEVQLGDGDGGAVKARVAGRDPGTNIVALRLDQPMTTPLPPSAEARLGTLVLALGRQGPEMGVTVGLGVVSAVGPAWHSQAGGRIDRRIMLDLRLSPRREGGPVIDAAGGLLGISTSGPRGRVLVIPAATIDRILEPLLSKGRVERGWLGLALQPVAIPDSLRAQADQGQGLMVMAVTPASPAEGAGIVTGDILVALDGLPLTRPAKLAEALGSDSIGRAVELRIIRAGAPSALTVIPQARSSE